MSIIAAIATSLDKTEYEMGETVTATFAVSTQEATTIGSFDFTLDYDSTSLQLESVSAGTQFTSMMSNGNKVAFVHSGTGVAVDSQELILLTATFTALEQEGDFTVSATDVVMTPVGVDSYDGTIASTAASATILGKIDVTIVAGAYGSLDAEGTYSVTKGTLFGDLTLPTPTADENYQFDGWYNGDTKLTDEDSLTEAITITALFVPETHDVTLVTGNASVTFTSGVTDYQATYGEEITFTVTPVDGYVINGVSYALDGVSIPVTLTSQDGVYTIPGDAITANVSIYVSAVAYYEITFLSGDYTTLTGSTTLYAKSGTQGLYPSVADLTSDTAQIAEIPTATAVDGYRLADVLWSDGETTATSANIAEKLFTSDVTYTAQVVKTWEISFVTGDATKGSVAETSNGTYDDGASVTIPDVTTVAGYQFDSWSVTPSTTADGDITYVANFVNAQYNITFPDVDGVTFGDKQGVTEENTITYGTDIAFAIEMDGVTVNAVSYTVANGATTILEAENEIYTIPGAEVLGDISITVSATNLYTVSFQVDEHGSLSGTTSFVVADGESLTADQLNAVVVTPEIGYSFIQWEVNGVYADPTTQIVTENVTYVAVFAQVQYSIEIPDDYAVDFLEGYSDGATYGTDVTFTIAATDKLITDVLFNGEPLSAEGGVYTIPGTAFSGNVLDLLLEVESIDGTMTFVDLDADYMAGVTETTDRQMVIMTVDELSGEQYQLADGTAFYWSSRYNAYVKLVDMDATQWSLSSQLQIQTGEAISIDYSGDLNGDGTVRSDDAGILNDMLHGTRTVTTTDLQILMADVTKDDVAISTSDVTWVLNVVLGIANQEV